MPAQNSRVHLLDADRATARPFQQTLELANVKTHATDNDVSPFGQNEINLISGVHVKDFTNGLRDRDLTLASDSSSMHDSLPLVGILLQFLTLSGTRVCLGKGSVSLMQLTNHPRCLYNPAHMTRRLDLILIVAIALAANVVYLVASNGDFYFPDSYTYLAPARQMMQGHGFVSEPEVPETLRTPVYPLLLVPFLAITNSPVPVVAFQHLLNALLAAAIYLLVLAQLRNRFAAIAAALVFALDTPTIHYANKILSETPFTFLLFVVFVLALKRQHFAINGLLCGVLVLLRPVAIVWFAVLALYFVLQRVPWRQMTAFIGLALVLPLAWAARNDVQTGVFTVSSISGTNLLFFRAAGTLSVDEGDEFKAGLAKAQKELQEEANDRIRSGEHVSDLDTVDQAVQARYFTKLAFETIRENKLAFTELTLRGLLLNLFDSDWDSMMVVSDVNSDIVRLSIDFTGAAVIVLAVVGLLALWRRDRPLTLLIALTVLYFLGISAGGESESRFRVPVMPQLAIAAGVGLEAIRRVKSSD